MADRDAAARVEKTGWDKRQSRILLAAVLTVVSLALVVYLDYTKPRPPRMESLVPIEVWYVWQNLRRGPDRNLAPPEKKFIENLRVNRKIRTGLMLSTGAGLLMMAISYAIPAPGAPQRRAPKRNTPQAPSLGEASDAHL